MKWILILAVGIAIGRYALSIDPNAGPTYGETGLPKNCRAIIQANIDGYKARQFSADEALGSIDRNCGWNGYSWKK